MSSLDRVKLAAIQNGAWSTVGFYHTINYLSEAVERQGEDTSIYAVIPTKDPRCFQMIFCFSINHHYEVSILNLRPLNGERIRVNHDFYLSYNNWTDLVWRIFTNIPLQTQTGPHSVTQLYDMRVYPLNLNTKADDA